MERCVPVLQTFDNWGCELCMEQDSKLPGPIRRLVQQSEHSPNSVLQVHVYMGNLASAPKHPLCWTSFGFHKRLNKIFLKFILGGIPN